MPGYEEKKDGEDELKQVRFVKRGAEGPERVQVMTNPPHGENDFIETVRRSQMYILYI